MIPVTHRRGETLAVFGMARSGLATAKALLAGGASVQVWDDGEPGRVAARDAGLEPIDLRSADWDRFSALVLAPGVPLTHPAPHWTVATARAAGVPIIGDTELFFAERAHLGMVAKCPVLAITGTNGKSTTTALTTHLLADAGRPVSMGGNIGLAVLSMPAFQRGHTYVLELSSYQIDLTPNLTASASALLNITPDHLDRHGNMANYASVKARIFAGLPPGAPAAVSIDDAHCAAIARTLSPALSAKHISVRLPVSNGIFASENDLVDMRAGIARAHVGLAGAVTLPGRHTAQNAAFAWALAKAAGATLQEVQRGIETFPGLAHRLELIARVGGVLFVNDSKATNAEATRNALTAFPASHWIVGGRAKDGGIAELADLFAGIAHAYLIGEAAQQIAAQLEGRVPYTVCGTLEAATNAAFAAALTRADGAAATPVPIVLSPACASFDQFPDFEKRGDAFKRAVEAAIGAPLGAHPPRGGGQ